MLGTKNNGNDAEDEEFLERVKAQKRIARVVHRRAPRIDHGQAEIKLASQRGWAACTAADVTLTQRAVPPIELQSNKRFLSELIWTGSTRSPQG
jgi:hypothetical protein